MVRKKFPDEGTPLYEKVVARVEDGDKYNDIAESLSMTNKSFRDALYNHGIKRKPKAYQGELPPVYDFPKSASWEEHIKVMMDMDSLVAHHLRVPNEITIETETDKPVCVVATADWQLGQFGVDLEAFQRDMLTIRDTPFMRVNIGGDGYQNIIQTSKMGSSHNQTPISVQRGLYYLTLEMLQEHIDSIRTGNHNYWATLMTGEDWDGELAKRLSLIYLKHYAMIHYKVGEQVYPWLLLHQSRYNSSFNLTHNCKQNQRLHFPDARVVIAEHHHVGAIEQYRYNNRECVAIRPGTYAVYDDYAQQYGFFGSHVCNPAVVMYPDRDKLVGFKDMYDAKIFMEGIL